MYIVFCRIAALIIGYVISVEYKKISNSYSVIKREKVPLVSNIFAISTSKIIARQYSNAVTEPTGYCYGVVSP
jgi:hypothetical protein